MTTKKKANKINIIDARCKGCGYCIEFCPQHVLFQSTETNAKGYPVVRVKDPEKCTACGLCLRMCPEFAIFVESDKDKPDTKI